MEKKSDVREVLWQYMEKKSYVKQDLFAFIITIGGSLLCFIFFGEKAGEIACYIFTLFVYGVYNYHKYSSLCPRCKEFCYHNIKSEDLSRDVISEIKYEKDNKGIERQKIYNYTVGKRKYYYKCKNCSYESTRVGEYKDQIK